MTKFAPDKETGELPDWMKGFPKPKNSLLK